MILFINPKLFHFSNWKLMMVFIIIIISHALIIWNNFIFKFNMSHSPYSLRWRWTFFLHGWLLRSLGPVVPVAVVRGLGNVIIVIIVWVPLIVHIRVASTSTVIPTTTLYAPNKGNEVQKSNDGEQDSKQVHLCSFSLSINLSLSTFKIWKQRHFFFIS